MRTSPFPLPDLPERALQSPKTSELLARRVRRMIALGELRDGDSLPREAELMSYFGVSRPTLRETMRLLEAERLVEVRRGSRTGAIVRAPQPKAIARPAGLVLQASGTTLREVLQARLGLEPLAARLLAERGDPGSLDRLAQALAHIRDDLAADRAPGASFARFHEAVVEESGNRALRIMSEMLSEVIARQLAVATADPLHLSPSELQARYRYAIGRCGALLDLATRGEGEAAERSWRRYLRAANGALLEGREAEAVIDILD